MITTSAKKCRKILVTLSSLILLQLFVPDDILDHNLKREHISSTSSSLSNVDSATFITFIVDSQNLINSLCRGKNLLVILNLCSHHICIFLSINPSNCLHISCQAAKIYRYIVSIRNATSSIRFCKHLCRHKQCIYYKNHR